MSRLSFKWRTILPVALALLVGIAIIVVTVGLNTSAAFETSAEEWAGASVDKIANQCNAELTSMLATIRGLAPVLETAIADGTASRDVWVKTLQNIVENNTAIYAAHIYIEPNLFDGRDEDYRNVGHHDATGVFAPYAYLYNGVANVRTESLSVHQKYGYYQQVRSAGHEIITDPYVITDQSGQEKMTATAALPIYVQGNFAGFIAADYYFDNMSTQLMESIALGVDQSLVVVLGSNGVIAANKNPVNVNKNIAVLGTDAQNAFSNSLSTKSSQFAFCNIPSLNDARCHVMFTPFEIGATGTSYVAMIAADSGQVNAASNMGVMVTAALGTVTLLVALAFLYFVVNNPSKAITVLNEELLDSTDTILSASTQIAASSDILAQGGVQQAASIEETSATMSQTAVLVQSTTENTHKAVTLSSEATAAAEEGYRKVSDLVSSMEELSRSSDEISNIIKIIDDIAFQTNILALNAAVEAARAGDAGRGFAVVAEEIRTLALDSAEAASNTSSIIERNMELSRRGVDSSIEVGAALGNINTKNTEVNSLLEQISNSSDEQARAAGQINIALSQMEDVTQSNAAVAEESAAASSELKNQADALRQITEEMTEVILGIGSSPARSASSSSGPRRNLPFAPRQNSADQSDFSSLPSPSSDDTTQGSRISPQPQRRIVPPNEVIPLEKDNRF